MSRLLRVGGLDNQLGRKDLRVCQATAQLDVLASVALHSSCGVNRPACVSLIYQVTAIVG